MKNKLLDVFKDKKNIAIATLSGLFLVSCVSGIAQNKTNELNTAYSKISTLESDIKIEKGLRSNVEKELNKKDEDYKKLQSNVEQLKKEIESYKKATEQPKDEHVATQTPPPAQVQATEATQTQATVQQPAQTQAPTQAVQQTQPETTATPRQVYYKNCKEARAAGVTPIHRGEPGYAPHLDRDGDGVACE